MGILWTTFILAFSCLFGCCTETNQQHRAITLPVTRLSQSDITSYCASVVSLIFLLIFILAPVISVYMSSPVASGFFFLLKWKDFLTRHVVENAWSGSAVVPHWVNAVLKGIINSVRI